MSELKDTLHFDSLQASSGASFAVPPSAIENLVLVHSSDNHRRGSRLH